MMHEMSKTGQQPSELTPAERRHAVRAVAGRARDATDLAELLDMLGLEPTEGRGTDHSPAVPSQQTGHRRALGKTPPTSTRQRTKAGAHQG